MAKPHSASSCASSDPRVKRLVRQLQKNYREWKKTQPPQSGQPAGWRTLRDQVRHHTGAVTGTSHTQLGHLHEGKVEWQNVDTWILMGLAKVYETTLEELSPDKADEMASMGSTQAVRKKTCTSSPVEASALVAA